MLIQYFDSEIHDKILLYNSYNFHVMTEELD